MTGPMRIGPWTSCLALLIAGGPARADAPGRGPELAQARPRPVQKGKKPVAPGDDPDEAGATTARAPRAEEPRDLEKIRTEAQAKLVEAAKVGDPRAAAQGVKTLLPFVKLADPIDAQVRASLVHVEDGQLARAEKVLGEARSKAAPEHEFIGLAYQAVRSARIRNEEQALAEITDVADPRPSAKILAQGLRIAPDSPRVAGAARQLTRKVERRNAVMSNEAVAQAIEALAILENARGDTVARLTKAAEAVGAGRLAEAEAMFEDIRVSAVGPEASDIAREAVTWVRARRIRAQESELAEAQKSGDVLEESRIIQALLALDPDHRQANRRARDIERRVVAARMDMVGARRKAGELGVAHWFAQKGLEVDANHAGLNEAKAEIEEELKDRTDLIMVVEAVTMDGASCGPFGPVLQKEAMEVASRREDLGGYVLSEGWTEAWKNGDDRAPTVTGSLVLTVTECDVTPASGSATVQWAVRAPQGVEGASVAAGEVDVAIAGAAIPKEEQDPEASNARRALADETATAISDRISESRDAMEAWLLDLAAYHMAQTRPADVASAWARFNLDRPVLYDEELAAKVQSYLSKQYR